VPARYPVLRLAGFPAVRHELAAGAGEQPDTGVALEGAAVGAFVRVAWGTAGVAATDRNFRCDGETIEESNCGNVVFQFGNIQWC
jgi:hypothetical protein